MKTLILTEEEYKLILTALTAASARRYQQGYEAIAEKYDSLECKLHETYCEPLED